MTQRYKALSPVISYGSVAYQYFANSFRGEVEYFAKVGIPVRDKGTGAVDILPWIKDRSNRDHLAATQIVANELEKLKNSAFQQKQNANAVSVSPLDQNILVADEAAQPEPLAATATRGTPTAEDLMQESLKLVAKNRVA